MPRSSLYEAPLRPAIPPSNALSAPEKTAVLAELNSERFADQTPYEAYPQLLDEGRYLCSLCGMYTGFWLKIRLFASAATVCDWVMGAKALCSACVQQVTSM